MHDGGSEQEMDKAAISNRYTATFNRTEARGSSRSVVCRSKNASNSGCTAFTASKKDRAAAARWFARLEKCSAAPVGRLAETAKRQAAAATDIFGAAKHPAKPAGHDFEPK